jgi:hypothetical protein
VWLVQSDDRIDGGMVVVVVVAEVEVEVEIDVEVCGSGTGSAYPGEAGREKSRCSVVCLPNSD